MTQTQLQEKIGSQLSFEEIFDGYEFTGDFNGSIWNRDGEEIPFCEKCLSRIYDTDEIFSFGFVYLCEKCRKEKNNGGLK